jgi:hypothetical protein
MRVFAFRVEHWSVQRWQDFENRCSTDTMALGMARKLWAMCVMTGNSCWWAYDGFLSNLQEGHLRILTFHQSKGFSNSSLSWIPCLKRAYLSTNAGLGSAVVRSDNESDEQCSPERSWIPQVNQMQGLVPVWWLDILEGGTQKQIWVVSWSVCCGGSWWWGDLQRWVVAVHSHFAVILGVHARSVWVLLMLFLVGPLLI